MYKIVTNRGFNRFTFLDRSGEECSLQESSLASERAIWLGLDKANPKILASKVIEGGTGWIPYIIPDDVNIYTRMHLTQSQVKELLPLLQRFAETGLLEE